ncbi:MAG: response regulator [Patescibacteria group bacterium]
MADEQKTILVIEDDKFLRELISQKLAKEGFNLSEAMDGEEGLKKIQQEKPDLILLDLILPGLDGFEVLSQAKQDPALSEIPVIILSNLGQKEDIERGLKMGAVDYLIKAHFTPGEIIEKIKQALTHA